MVYAFSESGSIIFYIAVIIIGMILVHYADKYDSLVLLVVAIVTISCVVGFRYSVGKDFGNYKNAFELITSFSTIEEAHKWYSIEESYFILCFIIKSLNGTFQSVVLFYGTLTTLFFILGIWYFRKDANIDWMMLAYFTTYFFGSFNTIRQYLSMAIILFTFRYIIERKPIKYFIFVAIAIFFHTSAIISIFIYFYGTIQSRIGKTLRIMNYVLPIILVFGVNKIIQIISNLEFGRMENYDTASTHFGFGFVVQLVILYLFLKSEREGNNSIGSEKSFFVKQILIVSTILCVLDYTLGDASRVRNYYSVIEIIALASYPSLIFNKENEYQLGNITIYDAFLLAYFALYLVLGFINRDTWNYPYQFMISF